MVILLATLWSCHDSDIHKTYPKEISSESKKVNQADNEAAFNAVLEKHLAAIDNKDLEALKSTLSPSGNMRLILVGSEVKSSVDSFLTFHEEWFQDTTWTFDAEIQSTIVKDDLGLAIVESMYQEPRRNGQPYFNRMTISYVLEKEDGNWYVINDHASSIEKTENN